MFPGKLQDAEDMKPLRSSTRPNSGLNPSAMKSWFQRAFQYLK